MRNVRHQWPPVEVDPEHRFQTRVIRMDSFSPLSRVHLRFDEGCGPHRNHETHLKILLACVHVPENE